MWNLSMSLSVYLYFLYISSTFTDCKAFHSFQSFSKSQVPRGCLSGTRPRVAQRSSRFILMWCLSLILSALWYVTEKNVCWEICCRNRGHEGDCSSLLLLHSLLWFLTPDQRRSEPGWRGKRHRQMGLGQWCLSFLSCLFLSSLCFLGRLIMMSLVK